MKMLHTRSRRLLVAFLLALGLLLLITILGYIQGTVAGGGLPPRPQPTPTPAPSSGTRGAYIELHLSGAATGSEGVWTAVEWQDEFGDWHVVTGWQGTTELDGTQLWWVAPEDFNTGPFRWVIYAANGGAQLGTSDSFDLPSHAGEIVIVEVDL
jgi:hypothetical protein